MIYYSTLATLLTMAWTIGAGFEKAGVLGALMLGSVGATVSLLLAGTIVLGWVPLCPLCLIVAVANVALVPVLKCAAGLSFREMFRELRAAGRYVIGGQAAEPAEAPWRVLGFITAGLVATATFQWVLIEIERRETAQRETFDPDVLLLKYQMSEKVTVPIDQSDPRLGPDDAPARLVVFSSFQCPSCRQFASKLKDLTDRFGGRVQIVFKHFPLSTSCNPATNVDLHPRACAAAKAAVAAHRQGKFWLFHDALFASDLRFSKATLRQTAQDVSLDLDTFNEDRQSAHGDLLLPDGEPGDCCSFCATQTGDTCLRRID